MEANSQTCHMRQKKELCAETFVFPLVLIGFMWLLVSRMGLANTINTMMNTAYSLLMDTVLYLTAICVIMGAVSSLLSEFGFVALANRILQPLMRPLYGLPGAAALGVVTTFLSDNPAILALADDQRFQRYFKQYQFPALCNLGTAFGMGLIVCTYMLGLSNVLTGPLPLAVAVGFLGAVIGSVISTRLMLGFTRKIFGTEARLHQGEGDTSEVPENMRIVREGSVCNRVMAALLEGGHNGVKMGVSIVPGVLIICTVVMLLINGPSADGTYTGGAYEGIRLLPVIAEKLDFLLGPLFGFSSPEAIAVPVTALGAAGASLGLVSTLASEGLVNAGDIAVFTSMCMCFSGYLSTHASMMDSLNCKSLIGKAIISHTIGGLCAGVAAHWIFILLASLLG